MKTIKVRINGTTPLLLNRFTEAQQAAASGGVRASITTDNDTPREVATPKLYVNAKGELVYPGPNLFAAIIQAGKFHKVGKSKVTTGKSSLVPAGIIVADIECPLRNNGEAPGKTKWEVDSRPIVNPATGGRRLCHRPRLDEWTIPFTLEVDDSLFDMRLVRQLVDDAGQRIGIGDFRPDRKGPFGKFKVVEWVVQ